MGKGGMEGWRSVHVRRNIKASFKFHNYVLYARSEKQRTSGARSTCTEKFRVKLHCTVAFGALDGDSGGPALRRYMHVPGSDLVPVRCYQDHFCEERTVDPTMNLSWGWLKGVSEEEADRDCCQQSFAKVLDSSSLLNGNKETEVCYLWKIFECLVAEPRCFFVKILRSPRLDIEPRSISSISRITGN